MRPGNEWIMDIAVLIDAKRTGSQSLSENEFGARSLGRYLFPQCVKSSILLHFPMIAFAIMKTGFVNQKDISTTVPILPRKPFSSIICISSSKAAISSSPVKGGIQSYNGEVLILQLKRPSRICRIMNLVTGSGQSSKARYFVHALNLYKAGARPNLRNASACFYTVDPAG